MKSIHTKFTLVMLIALTVCTFIIGGISLSTAQQVIDKDVVQLMSFLCGKEAQGLNNILGRIEQSVDILADHAMKELDNVEDLTNDRAYLNEYTKKMNGLASTIVDKSAGAYSIYMRFNPELCPPTSGFFKLINMETGEFENLPPVDISAYDSNDIEHVGWYYIPMREGKATWLEPYHSKNMDIDLISYVVPMYKDNVMVGVVGIDIYYTFIKQTIDDISLFYNGYAYLTDEKLSTIYDKKNEIKVADDYWESHAVERNLEEDGQDILYGYNGEEEEYRVTFSELENGMHLAISAPLKEIEQANYQLLSKILGSSLVIAFVFWLITSYTSETIIRPLKKLTKAAKEIADGNLQVNLECKTKDEVGVLAKSLQETTNQLNKRIEYINSLAYTDKLTNTKNNTSYLYEVAHIKEQLKKGKMNLALFIIDVNGLKKVNDEYGHQYGNQLLTETSSILIDVFGYDNVYRIGGDEFCVILKDTNEAFCQILMEKLNQELAEHEGEIYISAAVGYGLYDAAIDTDYDSLFKRMDEEMYHKKSEMKKLGATSKVNKQEYNEKKDEE